VRYVDDSIRGLWLASFRSEKLLGGMCVRWHIRFD